MKVPLVSSIINGIVKAIKALNCKCKSSCCESECTQSNRKNSSTIRIEDYSEKIGKITKEVDL